MTPLHVNTLYLNKDDVSHSLTVVANNHFQAKEVTNILQLKAMLTGRKVPVPPGLLVRYPELKDIAASDAV